jgi:non-specific serine/threonine protein kinase
VGVTGNTVARWERGELGVRDPAGLRRALRRLAREAPGGHELSGATPAGAAAPPRAGGPSSPPPSAIAGTAPLAILPAPPTSFVGRERELAALGARLRDPGVRLLTLTGPGGVGKTRLALEAARGLLDAGGAPFAHGVAFVDLAPTADPSLVPTAVAQVLGVQEGGGRPLGEALALALRDRRLLLVLDNFEHLLAAGPVVAGWLAASPGVTALVTSRARLRLAGEHVLPVPPLRLPGPESAGGAAGTPAPAEAVALFVERATAARPDFALTGDEAPAVAELCRRLEGLPLAIELAAARVALLPPRALLARLGQRLQVLTGGPRDAPARQRTLRATLDWSYALLGPDERALLARLAVFAGGCTLDAAAAVWGAPGGAGEDVRTREAPGGLDVLDVLDRLVEHHLVLASEQSDGEPRFRLLETVREYAAERLDGGDGGGAAEVRRRHAGYFLDVAERGAAELRGPHQAAWAARLEREEDNLRAALGGALGRGEAALALRLATALACFWERRARLTEGQRWLEAALAQGAGAPAALRARATFWAGYLAWFRDDLRAAGPRLEAAVAALRGQGDPGWLGFALSHLGELVLARGDPGRARALVEEAVALLRGAGDPWGRWALGVALTHLGDVAAEEGDAAAATAHYDESAALLRQAGDRATLALPLAWSAQLAAAGGEHAAARRRYEEALATARAAGHRGFAVLALRGLGALALQEGAPVEAEARYVAALATQQEGGPIRGAEALLLGLAAAAAARGQPRRAARLLGAAATLRDASGAALDAADGAVHARAAAAARAGLGEAAYEAAWAAGRALPAAAAVAEALAPPAGPGGAPASGAPAPASPLSAREREVAALIARGLTNRDIAAALIIAERTADTHVQHILNKLGFRARAQVAAWAAAQGLAPPAPDRLP